MPSIRACRPANQCEEWPSSLLLVAHKMAEKKTTTIRGTTKNGEWMSTVQAPSV